VGQPSIRFDQPRGFAVERDLERCAVSNLAQDAQGRTTRLDA
jgi:hypothetical protein